MEDKIIYELMDRFENSKMTVMKIEKEGLKLHLEKGTSQTIVQAAPIAHGAATQVALDTVTQNAPQQITQNQTVAAALAETAAENSYEKVKSPIVGVFYEAPSPQDPPYVKLGDKVKKGQVLCLVEAMKMMNELKAPLDGIVKTINGKNGELVEFDQILFEVLEC